MLRIEENRFWYGLWLNRMCFFYYMTLRQTFYPEEEKNKYILVESFVLQYEIICHIISLVLEMQISNHAKHGPI